MVRVGLWFGQEGETPGEFVTKHQKPLIRIRVPAVNDVLVLDDLFAAVIFAHEMGHHRSWLNGDDTAEYRAHMKAAPEDLGTHLTESLRLAVMEEEVRAWCYGREDLGACGFASWRYFERERGNRSEGTQGALASLPLIRPSLTPRALRVSACSGPAP